MTTMSKLLATETGFRPRTTGDDGDPAMRFALDRRFWPDARHGAVPAASAGEPAEPETLSERARIEGYQRGWEDGIAHCEQDERARREGEDALRLSLARVETAQSARLADRLRETVEALCHELIADVAIDRDLLARRAALAASLLAGAEEGATLCLHPDDAALLENRSSGGIAIAPDPAMPRGEIRMETPAGGIADGPGNWRDAIAEALRSC